LSIESNIDHEARLVSFRVIGQMDTDEMLAALKSCFALRKPGAVYDVISDQREVAEPATPDQIRTLVAELMRLGDVDGMRAAMIVRTDASYGMMRMMAAHTEALGIRVGIFREPAEARAFLER
jgi:hypothetical protein